MSRAVPALVSLFGSAAAALILQRVLRTPTGQSGVLWMAITPMRFLHSQTALDDGPMAPVCAWSVPAYACCLTDSPRFLFLAGLVGGLTFCSYAPGQGLESANGAATLILDPNAGVTPQIQIPERSLE